MTFRRLFEPLELGAKTLRNRIVFGAHTANMSDAGLPGARHRAYYLERALGGAAMIVVEPMPVHPAAVLTRGNFLHSSDAVIEPFRALTEPVKDAGAVILQQLYHVGQHGDADNSYHPSWSPSGLPSHHDSDGSHAMTEREIEETIEAFVAAARRCKEGGFDGVEIWAAYHSLLDQFWTPFSNRRDDRWGGSLENRTRLSRDIARRIRETCGEDFVIGLSISDEPDVEAALSREATAEIVALHDAEGSMDYVTCGTGSYFDFYKLMPTFLYGEDLSAPITATLRASVSNAKIIAESHIRTPENAEAVLARGDADLVAIVRGQIADPHLAEKARAGRPETIRGCISCNQMCWGRRSRDYWISCLVNPSAGREFEWGGDRFEKTDDPKRVLVIGGGPAGLEAARVAGERGHRVTLIEASSDLGGQFRLAGMQPRRGQILDFLNWQRRSLEELGVEIRYETPFDEEDVRAFGADRVIVATGSSPDESGFQRALPHLDALPGVENGRVWSAEDAMGGAARLGGHALILDEGGNWRSIGTALTLAERGCEVTIATPDPMIGKELVRSATDFPARKRLAELGVAFHTETAVASWSGNGARLVSLLTGAETDLPCSDLILATCNRANDGIARALDGEIPIALIGDAAAPRMAAFALHDGRKAGLQL